MLAHVAESIDYRCALHFSRKIIDVKRFWTTWLLIPPYLMHGFCYAENVSDQQLNNGFRTNFPACHTWCSRRKLMGSHKNSFFC